MSSDRPVNEAPPARRRRGAARGRSVDAAARAEVGALLGDEAAGGLPRRRDQLIEALHRIQDARGHLPAAHLAALAEALRLSQAEVYEVASFYHHFDVVAEGAEPPPPTTVRVCGGLSCRMAGAQALHDAVQAAVAPGQVRVQWVPCIGRCDAAPAACVVQAGGTGDRAQELPAATPEAIAAVLRAGPRCEIPAGAIGLAGYVAQGGYALLRDLHAGRRSADELIAALEHAGLRGLGGAGFPAGRKWRIVRGQPAPRLLVVNADEGEPGTFKDRWFLERDPHRFLEGALLAAAVVGCERIYVYLRDEYAALRALLQRELAALQANPPVPGLPPIELRRGAGAYICGEESALIESIEGRRGMPRLRPPYVAERGLFGRPTLEHNAETLHWVREIVERGPQWFAAQGRHGRQGQRAFSVSGRVRQPGVKLAPAGITLRELIDEHCGGMAEGHTLYAYLPGGASGGILPASLADLPLDFDTLQPHGCFIGSAAVVVLSLHDRAADAARQQMAFFADESCGQCTPCRNGTAQALALMQAPRWDVPLLQDLSALMRDASICGLGQAAPNPVDCVIRFFPHEVGAPGDDAGAAL